MYICIHDGLVLLKKMCVKRVKRLKQPLDWTGLIELYWNELNSIKLYWIELDWIELNLKWTVLNSTELNWSGWKVRSVPYQMHISHAKASSRGALLRSMHTRCLTTIMHRELRACFELRTCRMAPVAWHLSPGFLYPFNCGTPQLNISTTSSYIIGAGVHRIILGCPTYHHLVLANSPGM